MTQIDIKAIERKWLAYWEKEKVYKVDIGYCLSMHPGDPERSPDESFSGGFYE